MCNQHVANRSESPMNPETSLKAIRAEIPVTSLMRLQAELDAACGQVEQGSPIHTMLANAVATLGGWGLSPKPRSVPLRSPESGNP